MVVQNIYIQQGATFERTLNLTDDNGNPLDVSGYTANASLKKDDYSNTTYYIFETNLQTGLLTLRMEANTTITIFPGFYVYDVLMTNVTNTYKIAEGVCEVEGTVTQI